MDKNHSSCDRGSAKSSSAEELDPRIHVSAYNHTPTKVAGPKTTGPKINLVSLL